VVHEVGAFLRREEVDRGGDERDDLVKRAWARGAQERFQFREREFDRIEVGTVRGEKSQVCARPFNGELHRRLLVDGEVIEHHDVAGPQRGDEHLLDIGEKRRIIDGPVEHRRGVQAARPQGGDDGVRLPVPTRRVIADPQPARTARVAPEQVGRDPRFVHEDVLPRIAQRQPVLPAATRRCYITAPLFVGVYRFF
jgi:hypothetical protein